MALKCSCRFEKFILSIRSVYLTNDLALSLKNLSASSFIQPKLSIQLLPGIVLISALAAGLPDSANASTSTPGTSNSHAAKKAYAISPGLLSDVLAQFAAAAGVALSFDPTPLGTRKSEGLQGSYSIEEGFRKLLHGTGFKLTDTGNGAYSLISTQSGSDGSAVMTLPEMTVTSVAADGYVARTSASGTKTDTPIIETPQSISVVTRDEMDIRSAQTINEAIRYTPGVVVDNFGVETRGFEYLLLRGFNALTTSNFRDGLSNAASGLFNNAFITDGYSLERVDVLRGPTSVTFGRGDAGGIVNSVSKRPNANPIREIELQYGNFDRKRVAADLGAATEDGRLMFRLVTSALDSGTQFKYPDTGGRRAGVERFHIMPSVTIRPTMNTTITLMGEVLNNRSDGAFGSFFSVAPDGRRIPGKEVNSAKYSTDQSLFNYQLEHHFNEIFTIRQNFRYAQQNGDFRDFFIDGFNTPPQPFLLDRTAFATVERLTQTVLDTHLEAKFDTGPVRHKMLYGVDWNRTNANLDFFLGYADGSATPGINLNNPDYLRQIRRSDLLVEDSGLRIDQLGFYIQDQIRYNENWILTLSGRYDRVESTNTDFLAGTKTRTNDDAFTGRAGLTYLFSNGIAPYASFSQSFLPQAGFDAGGNSFDPTRGTQYEVGVKYQPKNGRGLYTAAFFDLTKSNVLTRDPNNLLFSVQTGEIRSRGVELEAKVELLQDLNLIGSFTYHDVDVTKSNDGFKGNTPIQVPTTLASGWLDYSLRGLGFEWLRGFSIGGGVRYVGRVFDDEENTSTTPAFTLFDATLRYERDPVLFYITASNIFNNKYIASRSYNDLFLGAERTVIGTLKYRF